MIRRAAKVAAFFLALLVASTFLTLALANWITKGDLEAELKILRESGDPLSAAALSPAPVPPERNAAPLFEKAAALVTPDLQAAVREAGEAWEKGDADAAAKSLAKLDPVWSPLDGALARPACVFPIAYDDGYGALLNHLPAFRPLARALQIRAQIRLSRGDAAGAEEDARRLYGLARLLEGDRTLCGWLVRCSVLVQASEVSWRLSGAGRSVPSEIVRAQLATLRSHLDSAQKLERAVAVSLFGEILEGRGRQIPEIPSYVAWPVARPLVQRDFAYYLAFTRRATELVFATAAGKELEELQRGIAGHPISGMVICNYATVARRRAEAESGLRLAALAGELEAIRKRTGAYPARLPEMPEAVDPVTGAPFEYESDGGTYSLRGGAAAGSGTTGPWPAPAGTR